MSVKFQDYYETLGVSRGATQEEIKKAFRKLARTHHPDVAKDKAGSEEKFKQINEAYEVLGDPEKRKRYDELGANWNQTGGPPPSEGGFGGWSWEPNEGGASFEFGGTGFSDFFERYFSGAQGGFGGSPRSSRPQGSFQQRGHDVEADILVSLEDALHGSQRSITLRRPDGTADTFDIRIPAGLREGQRIRLAGKGGPGAGGAPAGDVYLSIRFARHPEFQVDGADLDYDLDLAPWEAVLGVEVKISTLDGPAKLRVPPGTESGTRLRLKGRGMTGKDKQRGDLYAIVHIQVPDHSTAEEEELWKKLAAASNFNPRNPS
ncbi:J domain-containing protein [Luteolibacter ambystomatis]|uniref:J domain-containing protein n=1 Tax=Luteolibacter ambystomatis TaxID=2824561 RepID=A0A975J166_9BACT|nr:J domain-containing protein [Luteolibacter ambystomatis]QUE52138.1 J domain-containing protein [Luteolibacter ambystomatis]